MTPSEQPIQTPPQTPDTQQAPVPQPDVSANATVINGKTLSQMPKDLLKFVNQAVIGQPAPETAPEQPINNQAPNTIGTPTTQAETALPSYPMDASMGALSEEQAPVAPQAPATIGSPVAGTEVPTTIGTPTVTPEVMTPIAQNTDAAASVRIAAELQPAAPDGIQWNQQPTQIAVPEPANTTRLATPGADATVGVNVPAASPTNGIETINMPPEQPAPAPIAQVAPAETMNTSVNTVVPPSTDAVVHYPHPDNPIHQVPQTQNVTTDAPVRIEAPPVDPLMPNVTASPVNITVPTGPESAMDTITPVNGITSAIDQTVNRVIEENQNTTPDQKPTELPQTKSLEALIAQATADSKEIMGSDLSEAGKLLINDLPTALIILSKNLPQKVAA